MIIWVTYGRKLLKTEKTFLAVYRKKFFANKGLLKTKHHGTLASGD